MRGDAGYPVKRAGVIGDAYKALQAVCAQTLEAEAKVAAKLKREEDKRRKEEEARAPPAPCAPPRRAAAAVLSTPRLAPAAPSRVLKCPGDAGGGLGGCRTARGPQNHN